MTTYRLRDDERQAALEKALPGFGQILQDNCEKFFDNSNAIRVNNSDDGWEIYISKTDIKAVDDYNPHAWNKWPAIMPPCGVVMRLEIFKSNEYERITHRIGATFRSGFWRYSDGVEISIGERDLVRFRPWDDSENANE